MNRDLSVSAFSSEFAFENVNLRLSTNEGNTLMSWVNEKGTKEIPIVKLTKWDNTELEGKSIVGTPIGTAVLNHQLVVFTTQTTGTPTSNTTPDRIYVLQYSDDTKTSMNAKLLVEGNLNFHVDYPLETKVAYEADYIQKVYWTDNRNQPRLINIAASSEKAAKWNAEPTVQNFFFDFVPSFNMKDCKVDITLNVSSGGIFSPGVIQYALTYFNKYGQESNIAYLSPLYYLGFSDRAASPEEKVTSSFTIKVTNPDDSFDYVRIYSIQRTSLNATPFVRLVKDLQIKDSNELSFVDNGNGGSNVDPTELLYVGGKEVKALTMADKDNTLFVGNITEPSTLVTSIQKYYKDNKGKKGFDIAFEIDKTKEIALDSTKGIYSHTNMLKYNQREISTFKGGEVYRMGFQLQKRTGEWSEPILMNDVLNEYYPATSIEGNTVRLPYAKALVSIKNIASIYNTNEGKGNEDFYSIYKAIRPLVIYPNISDRNVLCQGVINPTVFNVKSRAEGIPYAQASWFFRPYIIDAKWKKDEEIKYNELGISVSSEKVESRETGEKVIAEYLKDDEGYKYFKGLGCLTSVYAMVADIKTSQITDILANSYLLCFDNQETESYKQVAFDGAICLGSGSSTTSATLKYVFIRKGSPFDEERQNEDNDGVYRYYVYGRYSGRIENVQIENYNFSLCNRLSSNYSSLYYFGVQDDEECPETYRFAFYAGNSPRTEDNITLYKVEFTQTNPGTIVKFDTKDGSLLRFTHYDSLYTINDWSKSTADRMITNVTEATQMEIEGAIKSCTNAYQKDTSYYDKSNTQFFVDQSIVTLNSPDIEFNTEVQCYNSENLKLRVIGAIPLTAYSSAHSIKISSEMLKDGHNLFVGTKVVPGAIITSKATDSFGKGELDTNITHNNISRYAGNRMVADYLWNDVIVTADTSKDDGVTALGKYDYLVYPWQKTGSLNNDVREKEFTNDSNTYYASSFLDTKKESHLLYSANTVYIEPRDTDEWGLKPINFEKIDTKIHLTEDTEIKNIRLKNQCSSSSEINYSPNIDTILTNEEGYKSIVNVEGSIATSNSFDSITRPISMKYKSTTHAIIALQALTTKDEKTGEAKEGKVPIMPYGRGKDETEAGELQDFVTGYFVKPEGVSGDTTYWGDTIQFSQDNINLYYLFGSGQTYNNYDFLWLGELYKDVDDKARFEGNTTWHIGGDTTYFDSNTSAITLTWTEGDTYYERYDCLKTYPFSSEDTNQNVEILSFMCETHVNIDGRYDKNRGQKMNYVMTPDNFNLYNPVYSQLDNFFSYSELDHTGVTELSYPNQVYYSKTKESGADVDLWTNITLASTLELDGDKGPLTSLNRFNNQLMAFQESGISQILYNENTQISTTEGVPIEIANSGKVQGKRYISDTIGCANKWALTQTPSGIYFIDSNDKSVYLFNGQLSNISSAQGFNSWAKQNIPAGDNSHKWNPIDYRNFRAMYDRINQDVLFINAEKALAYSEKLQCFTSFYDYGKAPYFDNLDDTGVWLKDGKVWKHRAGEYSNFFGSNKPFSMTLIGNAEPLTDKIFTNMEFRACVEGEGKYEDNRYSPTLPFDTLEAWDEYQHGNLTLKSIRNKEDKAIMPHGNNTILTRKFRIWRCDIPRDNAPIDKSIESKLGITRLNPKPLDRIRNPWVYLKLTKNAATEGSFLSKTEIHDLMAIYFA